MITIRADAGAYSGVDGPEPRSEFKLITTADKIVAFRIIPPSGFPTPTQVKFTMTPSKLGQAAASFTVSTNEWCGAPPYIADTPGLFGLGLFILGSKSEDARVEGSIGGPTYKVVTKYPSGFNVCESLFVGSVQVTVPISLDSWGRPVGTLDLASVTPLTGSGLAQSRWEGFG